MWAGARQQRGCRHKHNAISTDVMGKNKRLSAQKRASRVARTSSSDADGNAVNALSAPARKALDEFRLENVISHLLRRAHFAAEEIFAKEFAEEAITPRQKAALIAVYQRPGINQNELSALLFMDRNTVAEMVARLVRRALLKRRPSPEDRRAFQLFLARKGAALLDSVILRDARVERAIEDRIPRKDRAVLMRCLRLLARSP